MRTPLRFFFLGAFGIIWTSLAFSAAPALTCEDMESEKLFEVSSDHLKIFEPTASNFPDSDFLIDVSHEVSTGNCDAAYEYRTHDKSLVVSYCLGGSGTDSAVIEIDGETHEFECRTQY